MNSWSDDLGISRRTLPRGSLATVTVVGGCTAYSVWQREDEPEGRSSRWTFAPGKGEIFSGGLATGDGPVHATVGDHGVLTEVDTRDGRRLWQVRTAESCEGADRRGERGMSLDDSDPGYVLAPCMATGELLWRGDRHEPSWTASAPAPPSWVYDVRSGTPRWRAPCDGALADTPAVRGGVLVGPSTAGICAIRL